MDNLSIICFILKETYGSKENSLLAMVKNENKGSLAKLVQYNLLKPHYPS